MLEPLFPPLALADCDRETLVRDFMAQGLDWAGAHECTDLALHAATETMRTLDAIPARASRRGIQMQAYDVALQIVAADLKRKNHALRALAKEYGARNAETSLTLKGDNR